MTVDPSVDLRLLRSFVVLAEELHFSRAAERLRIGQPALSQQIARLEKQLGVTLVERPPRAISLTDAGRALLNRVRPALVLIDQGLRESRAHLADATRALDVGHLSSLALGLLPRMIASVRASHPDLVLAFHQLSIGGMLSAVRSGDIDIGLIHTTVDLPLKADGLRVISLARGPRMLVMAADDPLAAAPVLSLSMARSRAFILPSGGLLGALGASVEGACRRYGFSPTMAAQADDAGMILRLVAQGVGVALMPWLATTALPEGVVARPLADEFSELTAIVPRDSVARTAPLLEAARSAAMA